MFDPSIQTNKSKDHNSDSLTNILVFTYIQRDSSLSNHGYENLNAIESWCFGRQTMMKKGIQYFDLTKVTLDVAIV